MKGYCIDSDILIDYLRGQNKAREFLLSASKEQVLWISIVGISGSGLSADEIKRLYNLGR